MENTGSSPRFQEESLLPEKRVSGIVKLSPHPRLLGDRGPPKKNACWTVAGNVATTCINRLRQA